MEWLRSIIVSAIALVSPGDGAPPPFYGYVEGEYVRLGPRDGGTLERLEVLRGQTVDAGAVVAIMESGNERATLAEAKGRLAQATAQLANLRTGRRTPEIEALQAQRSQAQAALRLSEAQWQRQSQLPAGQVVSRERLDQARAAVERDRARVAELTADIEVARLAARDDEIDAAAAAVDAAAAAVAQATWKLDQRTLRAPDAALVADTFYEPGEFVAAGSPIVSLLPPDARKLRFFVPERALSGLRIGQTVAVACDRCPADRTATISFIAPQAEFTPPVIYSRETRAKLVFMVEAKPADPAGFHPGLPVEVRTQP